MRQYRKLIGEKFGLWTVIKYDCYYKYQNCRTGYHKWICKCDCGTEQSVREQGLIRGKTTRCQKCKSNHLSQIKIKYKIPCNLYLPILTAKEKRNIDVNITDEELYNLYLKQDKKCALTGLDIHFSNRAKTKTYGTASIDRINSTKGYTIDNVQWVHKDVNIMKLDFNQEKFIEFCNLVSKKHPRQ